MNEEEKKAIELLEQYLNFGNKEGVLCKNLRTIYTIIEKQSKEIEELKKEREKYPIAMNDEQYRKVIELAQKDIKDKIKAKIEEYDKTLYYAETEEGMAELKDYEYDEAKYGKNVLQSLLEKE